MTGLTTHILDLSHGQPAANVKIELYYFEPTSNERKLIRTAVTNEDGRCDAPLLSDEEVTAGSYELLFYIGEYFRNKEVVLPDPPFLEQIPVRFGISNPAAHYHVPLLVSPWGYQVYRGS
ncbi:hydroxyisourate hydrolase [Peribacillus asahii]|uniref:hydroxyisourate hydrolase n=1 Tax=Peribacillus asahii TaxID=228899 RepID=UPI00207A7BE0|nr:hydroxyisourate hydrolase [Peribacillus asahii]USK85870.1 hydroxyisourate hydrolase [Peribacillus asahii]